MCVIESTGVTWGGGCDAVSGRQGLMGMRSQPSPVQRGAGHRLPKPRMTMHRISTLVSVITLLGAGANAPRAYGQDVTSLTRPITIGISGGVAVPSGELSTGRHNGFSGTNTGYDITGSVEFALPVSSFGVRVDASYDRFGTRNVAFPAIAPACTAVCATP